MKSHPPRIFSDLQCLRFATVAVRSPGPSDDVGGWKKVGTARGLLCPSHFGEVRVRILFNQASTPIGKDIASFSFILYDPVPEESLYFRIGNIWDIGTSGSSGSDSGSFFLLTSPKLESCWHRWHRWLRMTEMLLPHLKGKPSVF